MNIRILSLLFTQTAHRYLKLKSYLVVLETKNLNRFAGAEQLRVCLTSHTRCLCLEAASQCLQNPKKSEVNFLKRLKPIAPQLV